MEVSCKIEFIVYIAYPTCPYLLTEFLMFWSGSSEEICWHAARGGSCLKPTILHQPHIQNIDSISKEISHCNMGWIWWDLTEQNRAETGFIFLFYLIFFPLTPLGSGIYPRKIWHCRSWAQTDSHRTVLAPDPQWCWGLTRANHIHLPLII